MLRLPVAEMLRRIERGEPFEAVADDYSFRLKIEEYAPLVCGAVHDTSSAKHYGVSARIRNTSDGMRRTPVPGTW